MLEYLGDGKKRSGRNVMLLQNFLPIGRGALAQHSFYFGKQAGAMFDAALVRRVTSIFRPFRLVQGLAKALPDPVVGDRYRDPCILAPEHLIRNDAGMPAVEGLRIFSGK
jgi:hypothetical protein